MSIGSAIIYFIGITYFVDAETVTVGMVVSFGAYFRQMSGPLTDLAHVHLDLAGALAWCDYCRGGAKASAGDVYVCMCAHTHTCRVARRMDVDFVVACCSFERLFAYLDLETEPDDTGAMLPPRWLSARLHLL